MAECPPSTDLRAYGLEQARQNGVPEDMYSRQIQQESNWEHCRADGSLKISSGNAVGVAQIIQRWHPNVDVTDPWASLRYSTMLMRQHFNRFGSWRKALAAYNWGGGHVGGYTDATGVVHTPWDGTRDWQCSAGHGVSEQCKHYLDVALGPGWPEPNTAPEVPGMTVYEQYPDPEPAGRFTAPPKGVIFHGSRSGRAGNPLDAEYKATAGYEVNNPLGLGWNATVGPGKVAIHLDVRSWGWNARAASDKYVAVEIAQPTVNDPLPDSVPVALADYIFDHVWPVWGELDWHFPSHAELEAWGETGQKDGKTDLYPVGDERMNVFRQTVYDRLTERKGAVVEPPIVLPPADSRLKVLVSEIRERLDEIERLAS